ncbi:ATP-binding protein [Kitasatospora sp. NPDC048365]|uniref:ATP-binding protein n=1 Tax=Kitasatospora sp. NPDC048365 TaxID=3364050 RepID=UPI00371C9179
MTHLATEYRPKRQDLRSPDVLDVVVPPDGRQITQLRAITREFVRRSSTASDTHVEDVLLVVTELATNVLRHTGRPGRLVVIDRTDGTEIRVSDSSRHLPRPQPRSLRLTSGRGLVLVQNVSTLVAVTLDPGGGKTISVQVADTGRRATAA